MKIDTVNKIIKNHNYPRTIEVNYDFDEFLGLIVKQDDLKITLCGFNNKSNRPLNLKTNKYSKLIEAFNIISKDIYFEDTCCHIELDINKLEKRDSKVVGYCRVSTKVQLEGNGLAVQEQEILAKYPNAKIVKEQFTGAKSDRPMFKEVVRNLESNDTLIVTKLDRLARNTVEGIQIIEELFAKGVSVHVLNIGLLENTTMGKFFLTTLLAVAEMERNIIIERTQAGKEVAKQNPHFKDGRPNKYSKKQIEHALKLLESNSYKEVEQLTGISKSTLIRAKNKFK